MSDETNTSILVKSASIEIRCNSTDELWEILTHIGETKEIFFPAPATRAAKAAGASEGDNEESALEEQYKAASGKRFSYRADGKDAGMTRVEALRAALVALGQPVESITPATTEEPGEVD